MWFENGLFYISRNSEHCKFKMDPNHPGRLSCLAQVLYSCLLGTVYIVFRYCIANSYTINWSVSPILAMGKQCRNSPVNNFFKDI
jgi:hypothetical protein